MHIFRKYLKYAFAYAPMQMHNYPKPSYYLISKFDCRSETLSTSDSKVFEFDMKSLKELLRKQAEQNPNASYFNLDLLKYQVRKAFVFSIQRHITIM